MHIVVISWAQGHIFTIPFFFFWKETQLKSPSMKFGATGENNQFMHHLDGEAFGLHMHSLMVTEVQYHFFFFFLDINNTPPVWDFFISSACWSSDDTLKSLIERSVSCPLSHVSKEGHQDNKSLRKWIRLELVLFLPQGLDIPRVPLIRRILPWLMGFVALLSFGWFEYDFWKPKSHCSCSHRDFSWGLPGARGACPFGDESEAADEGESAGESDTAGQGLLTVSFLPRKGTFQANVPRLPLCYLRARSADGRGEAIYLCAFGLGPSVGM